MARLDSFLQDLRYGLRGLRRSPGIALVAVLSLGLAIGANTTVFTWMETFVLRPLPGVEETERLVALGTRPPGGRGEWSLSYPAAVDWREQSQTIEVAGFGLVQLALRTRGQAERIWGMLVTGNYFDVLRVRPLLGRTFLPDEERSAAPVAVIGYGLWRREFAGDSGIVGRHVLVNGNDLTVIGVAPPKFGGSIVGLSFDVWVPVTLQPMLTEGRNRLALRGSRWLDAFGRLKPGVSVGRARAELDALAGRLAQTYPEDRNTGAIVKRMSEEGAQAWFLPVFSALLGVTAVVLLVSCANITNLLLARAAVRRREIGIRLAVGAGRWRLVRQLLTESLVLSLLGGVVGVLVAFWSRDFLRSFVPATPYPVGIAMDIDARVLGFALAVTLVTTLVFGIAPALQTSKVDLVPALKDEIGGGPSRRSRFQAALVVGQLALSLVSLVCAGLFVRSLDRAQRVDPGFGDPERVLLVSTDLHLAGYADTAGLALTERLLERVRALPEVASASVAMLVPLGFGGGSSNGTEIEGYTPQADENTSIEYNVVGADYFRTMGIRMVRGRGIGPEDRADAPPVAVVNEAFVRRYWPGQDAIGKRIRQGGRWMTVVGVAQDGKYRQLSEAPYPFVYRAHAQGYVSYLTLHVRSAGAPASLIEPVRRTFAALDPGLPFLDVRTMREHMGAALFIQEIGAWMLAAFGALALALSAVGIYGVMSYAVSQRTREIGVRVALGAVRRDVLGIVVGRAMKLAGAGLLIGIVAALGAGRLLRSQLFGISPSDPLSFTAVALLLGGVAFAASYLPARRAARIDPMAALRYE